MANTIISIRNVIKRFGSLAAVDNVSIDIKEGEFFVLLGPSGCGKTTLLRMIAGFEVPSEGQILIDGQDMANVPPNKIACPTSCRAGSVSGSRSRAAS